MRKEKILESRVRFVKITFHSSRDSRSALFMSSSILKTRDDFSESTKQLLARRAGFRCSICNDPTVGPHSEPGRSMFLGEASHIYSAAPQGPRANPLFTTEQRTSASNGIHLCKVHAKLIDIDVTGYPADRLHEIKDAHEHQIRALIVGPSADFDEAFLSSHESQIVHGRGSPTLSDLWVPRYVTQPQINQTPAKQDAVALTASESGILLISGEQWTGRTSLLKRMAAGLLGQRNCVWLNGRELTESALKDPIRFLAKGYRKLNANEDGWATFLDAPPEDNFVFIDDLHLSPLNIASKRKFLCVLQNLSYLVTVTVSGPFQIELLAVSTNDGLRLSQWGLLDLSRSDCAHLVDQWCRFGAESTTDHELDISVASAQEKVELLFGKKLMPRQPLFVLTALQMIDAGSPMDTAVGSFGGVYETVIHLAIAKNARNQAAISSERAYLEELAYWCESQSESSDRQTFNKWFAERKGIGLTRVEELELSLLSKGFLARHHQGFRFHYQKYYFTASFVRSNPDRSGIKEYIAKLITNCWNEDCANTALFLAYLQPSSALVEALLAEIRKVFAPQKEFEIKDWHIDVKFPKDYFRGLNFTNDPETNRRLLAERLDETDPVNSAVCATSSSPPTPQEDDQNFLDFLKSFHLIKLAGQLIRNSPIALDAQQKQELVMAGFNLSLRVVSFMDDLCGPVALQSQALNQLRERVLKHSDRVELEAKLTGLIYKLYVFLVFSTLRHASHYLAHPDLELIYQRALQFDSSNTENLSYKLLGCGINFELRSPDSHFLKKVYGELTPAGKDLLHMWTWIFLSFNRVPVSKRQAILESVGMAKNVQLLLPKEVD